MGRRSKRGASGRFAALKAKLMMKGFNSDNADAIAASAGRKKYGKAKFQQMAEDGKKNKM